MGAPAEVLQRPRVLFIDDEPRVLNSMRAMFRRQYDTHFAANGHEAIGILEQEDIDVIVADHRMPQMTGVELLTRAKELSPRSVRILLTGYADQDAVESSINEGEVFRFLTKPCAPDKLKETVELAARLALDSPAPAPASAPTSASAAQRSPVELEEARLVERSLADDAFFKALRARREADRHGAADPSARNPSAPGPSAPGPSRPDQPASGQPAPGQPASGQPASGQPTPGQPTSGQPAAGQPTPGPAGASSTKPAASTAAAPESSPSAEAPARRAQTGLGILVFSADETIHEAALAATRGRVPVYRASNIVQVVKILNEHAPGVLLTDISEDKATIQSMTARLKEHLPELVTIAVSEHRDVLDMVWLINHGQIFRFLRKPLSPGRCAVSFKAALMHHRKLREHPELVKRHTVDEAPDGHARAGKLSRLAFLRKLWGTA